MCPDAPPSSVLVSHADFAILSWLRLSRMMVVACRKRVSVSSSAPRVLASAAASRCVKGRVYSSPLSQAFSAALWSCVW